MKMPREDFSKTRGRLLKAAAEIFAVKGYRDATIADICARAEANTAAVNYHFRDKESLYREAWRQSLMESLKAYPPDGEVGDNAPPEERLRGQIKALLNRITDENNKEFPIVQRELANPTGLLEDVMRDEIEPMKVRMHSVIRELLGPDATETQVQSCEISIFSQCVNPAVTHKRHDKNTDKYNKPPSINDIKAYIEHVITFSLGGIKAVLDAKNSKKVESIKSPQNRSSFRRR
jgi:TetR/AcrR family transcriptional regulator, regulator of cefoperazone and chloramphenicol sensitivity